MVFARINPRPVECVPRVGKMVVVEEPVKYGPYDKIKPGTAAIVKLVNSNLLSLVRLDGTLFNLKPESRLRAVGKQERLELRTKQAESTAASPVGKGNGQMGTDPEVFATRGDGTVLPAFLFLPDKKHPIEDRSSGSCNKIFYDGFQAEFTVSSCGCLAYGCDYVRYGLLSVLEAAKKADPTAKVTWQPVMDIPKELIEAAPQDGVILGCDPSKNAYFEGPNPALDGLDPTMLPYRTAGYHVHFGMDKPGDKTVKKIVRLLDAVVGVASVSLFRGMEDPRRRKYYGLAGEYRLPPHGLEWRTLSSCVLCHPAIYHLIMDLSRAVKTLAINHHYLWVAEKDEVQEVINNLNLDLATEILTRNKRMLEIILKGIYPTHYGTAQRLISEGAKNLLPIDMSTWSFEGVWTMHSDGVNCQICRLKL